MSVSNPPALTSPLALWRAVFRCHGAVASAPLCGGLRGSPGVAGDTLRGSHPLRLRAAVERARFRRRARSRLRSALLAPLATDAVSEMVQVVCHDQSGKGVRGANDRGGQASEWGVGVREPVWPGRADIDKEPNAGFFSRQGRCEICGCAGLHACPTIRVRAGRSRHCPPRRRSAGGFSSSGSGPSTPPYQLPCSQCS